MWSDNETAEDLLGFKVHADLLIDVVNDDTVLPVTIGVFGDWGSGKSSILQIIYNELKGDDDKLKDGTLVMYFNGWVFEGYDDAKAALLESIIEKFDKHKQLGSIIKDETKKLLKSVNWMRVLGLGFKNIVLPTATAYATGGLSLIPFLAQKIAGINPAELSEKFTGENAEASLKELMKDKEEDDTTLVREFREDFKKMIDKSNIKKLVVIIDDLDRCTYERIIENLEAIKLFLNVEKTAFIIGADPRIVRNAIEFRYKTEHKISTDSENKNQRIVSDYLEKLIQIPYTLPKLSDHEVETYMTLLFAKRELSPESFTLILSTFSGFRQKNRYGVFGFADIESLLQPTEKSKLGSSVSLIASLSSIIAHGLNGNPRQIKRFLNTFTLRNRLAAIAAIPDFKVDILAKLMVLEYAFPDLFAELYRWQGPAKEGAKELKDLETLAASDNLSSAKDKYNVLWQDNQVGRWLKLEPKLSDIDLSDYFWISRDQLLTSMNGSSLVPPHVRSLFKSLLTQVSAKLLKDQITKEVLNLPAQNLIQLFALLEQELIKNPEKTEIHKVYFEIMGQNCTGSIGSYEKAILQIPNHDVIPFSLRSDIELAIKSNPEVEQIKQAYNSGSQIAKSLKKTN